MELILNFILKLVVIGCTTFIANKVLSKKTKEFGVVFGEHLTITSKFYKE